ncbi:MAG: hypothetical protein K5872_02410 [Rhizobiaceae bacterium]|nr:hypothetical protein [Rhizobiaceae bacterium]MCV0405063.1 hypothetical protein [Rhizobiaceae bacterium]
MGVMRAISKLGAIGFAALIVASCTVVVDEGPRPGPVRPGPQFCPQIYDPVCAVRRGDRETFPNACEADRAGYRVIRDGECRRGGPITERPRPGRPQACTREYRPVCARRGGNVRTFGNACEARSAGYRIIAPGQC